MGTSGKALVMFLFGLNLFGVCLGFMGIGKMERYHAHPFNVDEGRRGKVTRVYMGFGFSNRTVLFWHSRPGAAVIWAGTILLPALAAVVIWRKERPIIGTALLFLSFLPLGVTGFFMWLHAFLTLPHDW